MDSPNLSISIGSPNFDFELLFDGFAWPNKVWLLNELTMFANFPMFARWLGRGTCLTLTFDVL